MARKIKTKYNYINHTADIEFNAYGDSLAQLFENSELALFNSIGNIKKIKKQKSAIKLIRIREYAQNIEDLLWQVLQSSLSILDAKNQFGYGIKKIKINIRKNQRAKTYCAYLIINSKKRNSKYSNLEVKGISKYDLKIVKKNNNFISSVVADV
ncbi:MAG: archease [Candidatus Marsarchaeota archaeon]|nr:archease [Candidatus Marsarchaeota archaeon]MCL5095091.1 archease [Candidatus Marsarchaeota archaeon]